MPGNHSLQAVITNTVVLRGRYQTLPVALYGWTIKSENGQKATNDGIQYSAAWQPPRALPTTFAGDRSHPGKFAEISAAVLLAMPGSPAEQSCIAVAIQNSLQSARFLTGPYPVTMQASPLRRSCPSTLSRRCGPSWRSGSAAAPPSAACATSPCPPSSLRRYTGPPSCY